MTDIEKDLKALGAERRRLGEQVLRELAAKERYTPAQASLARYAGEIEVGVQTLRTYKRVATQLPPRGGAA